MESVLNQLPQFTPAVTQFNVGSEFGVTGTSFFSEQLAVGATRTPGQATLSLRGLGPNRNLVLLDGRRAMPINAGMSVSINTIPAAAIDRVETITGGASSVYGADAVAGVVNFITKRDFEGIDFDTQYGQTAEGDGMEFRYSLLVGANSANDRGNVLLGFERSKRDEVFAVDRDFKRSGLRGSARAVANGLLLGGRLLARGDELAYPGCARAGVWAAAGELPNGRPVLHELEWHAVQGNGGRRVPLQRASRRRARQPVAQARDLECVHERPTARERARGVSADPARSVLAVRPRSLRALGQRHGVRSGAVQPILHGATASRLADARRLARERAARRPALPPVRRVSRPRRPPEHGRRGREHGDAGRVSARRPIWARMRARRGLLEVGRVSDAAGAQTIARQPAESRGRLGVSANDAVRRPAPQLRRGRLLSAHRRPRRRSRRSRTGPGRRTRRRARRTRRARMAAAFRSSATAS